MHHVKSAHNIYLNDARYFNRNGGQLIFDLVFDVPFKGSLPLFFGVTLLYFSTAGLGLVAATMSLNLAQVGMLTIMILAPIMLLSGVWTPPEAMPSGFR